MANFGLDSFRIAETRARHIDADFGTVSLKDGNQPYISMTRAMGCWYLSSGSAGSSIAHAADNLKVTLWRR